jgi:ABC-type uncharacterized transport system YnjBCD ATPase subunit
MNRFVKTLPQLFVTVVLVAAAAGYGARVAVEQTQVAKPGLLLVDEPKPCANC